MLIIHSRPRLVRAVAPRIILLLLLLLLLIIQHINWTIIWNNSQYSVHWSKQKVNKMISNCSQQTLHGYIKIFQAKAEDEAQY
jgi:hypothetical protein